MTNYWINLRNIAGKSIAEQMKINETEFCSTVLWPMRPGRMLLNACVDMELLSIKHRNKTADLVQEYERDK